MSMRPQSLLALSLLLLAACSNDPTLNNTSGAPSNFVQIDRVGKPGLNTLFVPFAQHDANDRNAPNKDVQVLSPEISTFLTQTAGRSAATVSAAQSLLVNGSGANVLIADFSQSGSAGYLGVETAGKLGKPFGGRALTDDVMAANLGIAFGNTLTSIGLAADDGKENNGQNGTPNLANDNVSSSAKHFGTVFPYLGAPR